jgi:autotransporter passenger strand-loop-strand repeat protein
MSAGYVSSGFNAGGVTGQTVHPDAYLGGVTVSNGQTSTIYAGNSAGNAYVYEGGYLHVLGEILNSSDIFGVIFISNGAYVQHTEVLEGGTEILSAGGSASDSIISGAHSYELINGTESGGSVYGYGSQYVENGGTD